MSANSRLAYLHVLGIDAPLLAYGKHARRLQTRTAQRAIDAHIACQLQRPFEKGARADYRLPSLRLVCSTYSHSL